MIDWTEFSRFLAAFLSHWVWLAIALIALGFSLRVDLRGGASTRIALVIVAILCFAAALVATISGEYSEMIRVRDQVRDSLGVKPGRGAP